MVAQILTPDQVAEAASKLPAFEAWVWSRTCTIVIPDRGERVSMPPREPGRTIPQVRVIRVEFYKEVLPDASPTNRWRAVMMVALGGLNEALLRQTLGPRCVAVVVGAALEEGVHQVTVDFV